MPAWLSPARIPRSRRGSNPREATEPLGCVAFLSLRRARTRGGEALWGRVFRSAARSPRSNRGCILASIRARSSEVELRRRVTPRLSENPTPEREGRALWGRDFRWVARSPRRNRRCILAFGQEPIDGSLVVKRVTPRLPENPTPEREGRGVVPALPVLGLRAWLATVAPRCGIDPFRTAAREIRARSEAS
jgi:hypothetical protein